MSAVGVWDCLPHVDKNKVRTGKHRTILGFLYWNNLKVSFKAKGHLASSGLTL